MPLPGSRGGGDEITKIARRLARLHPDAPARTLAHRLVSETNGAITHEAARKRFCRLFGVNGSKDRRKMAGTIGDTARPPRMGAQVPEMPPTSAEPWLPYELGVVGLVGVLSDIHVPYHDEKALGAAVDALRGDKVDALVLNGDVCDFYSISRYTRDPRKRNFRREVDACREMLGWIRKQFPEIPIVFKAGNHEERWYHWLWNHAPEISDDPVVGLENWLQMPRHQIAYVDDQRPIMAGQLPILHGHEKGKGFVAPVNQARGAFLRLQHTALEGHGHRTSAHCEPDMFGREIFCWSTGCLCDLRPEYARLNKFNHGFASIQVHADGQFDVRNFRIASGRVRTS